MAKVTVYSTPSCPYCIRLKNYLEQKGIAFSAIDVSADKTGLDKMIEISGQMGVPVIDVAGQVVVGFEKDKLDALLQ